VIDLRWKDGRLVTGTGVSAADSVKMISVGRRTIQVRLRAGRPRGLNAAVFTSVQRAPLLGGTKLINETHTRTFTRHRALTKTRHLFSLRLDWDCISHTQR
jgi:hypothetical protein